MNRTKNEEVFSSFNPLDLLLLLEFLDAILGYMNHVQIQQRKKRLQEGIIHVHIIAKIDFYRFYCC